MKDNMRVTSAGLALTPMQSWMFYESIPAERPWVNLQQAVVRIDGRAVDSAALAAAWEEVAARHPALRASVRWRGRSLPEQVVAGRVAVKIAELDWQNRPESATGSALETAPETAPDSTHDSALARFLAEDRARGVEIEDSPPWRVTLIRLAPDRAVMVWTVHNTLVDGTGVGVVLEDLFALIDGDRAPGEALSPGLSTARYVEICETIAAPAPAAAGPYFARYLDGFEPLGLAGTERDPGDGHATLLTTALGAELTAALRAASDRCGGNLRNLVEAAWGVMLARWQNAPDLVFGVTTGGRRLIEGGERAVGCFLNTLPRRLKITGATTLGEAVAGLRADAKAMAPFEQVSVAEIRQFCHLHGASLLFDTVVMFDRGSMHDLFAGAGAAGAGLSAELLSELDLPLSLAVYTDSEMRLELEADPSVVPADRARLMFDQLLRLLRAFATATPETKLGALDMLGDAARGEILALGEPPQTAPGGAWLAGFAAQVAAAPDAVAVEQAGRAESLSYAALDAASDRLAAVLQAKGAGPGDFIAIHLARSPEYIVALLAVLKSGAAFLPIDPGYPDAVIGHMVADSGAKLVISREMAPPPGAEVLAPDVASATPFTPVTRDPAGPAYIIYTSGSTGKPKGVVVPDRAMVGHSQAIGRYFRVTPRDRVYQFISLSFDFSLEEILPTLYQGATLVLRSDEAVLSGAAFIDELTPLGITQLHLPTAFFNIATDYLSASGRPVPESLELVNIGGERANPQIVRDWLALAPDVRLLNGYGPTEAAVTVTYYEPVPDMAEGDIPIGTLVDHGLGYVVAPDGSLAPRGAIGELWIGGVSVGLGYHGLPEKTAEVFLDDPFRAPPARVYRTGDRARWRADGNLEFFGRNDRQVKVRGFRIDLGHVERVLETAQPELRVLAGVRDAGTPSARLLAWAMSAEGGAPVDLDALTALAEAELPPQMRPRIVVVDEYPRTAGGKVDLAALPDPGQSARPPAESGPMSALEAQIAEQMAAVLRLDAVGAEDDFYDLGGHSLLAAELVGRIEVHLGHKISVIDLRQHPSVRGLAGVVETGSSGPRNIFPIQPEGSRPPLFGVHILGGRDSYYTALAAEFGPDQPLLGVTLGTLARDKPVGVEETAKRYFDEIQTFHPTGPLHLAAVSLGAYFAWELAWMLNEAGREIRHFALFDADGPGGRDAHRGPAKLAAILRTIRHRGLGAIPTALMNRVRDARHAKISARMAEQAAAGEGIEIRGGDDFIASNDLAVANYTPKPLNVPVTIYRSNENFFDTADCLKSGLGWDKVALAGFTVIDVPGGHLTMLEPPHATVLARHMARAMAEA